MLGRIVDGMVLGRVISDGLVCGFAWPPVEGTRLPTSAGRVLGLPAEIVELPAGPGFVLEFRSVL